MHACAFVQASCNPSGVRYATRSEFCRQCLQTCRQRNFSLAEPWENIVLHPMSTNSHDTPSNAAPQVNAEFSLLMQEIFNNPNAIKACCTDPKMMEKITAMDSNLEVIQKSLDQYLETKRCVCCSCHGGGGGGADDTVVEAVFQETSGTSVLGSGTLDPARPML